MKISILILLSVFLNGCVSYNSLGVGENVWVEERLGHFSTKVFYCTSKPKENELKPTCFEADIRDRNPNKN